MNKDYLKVAFRLSLPVLFGYLALGMGAGILLASNGYPIWLAPVMSIMMYAGAGQYIAIALYAKGASFPAILTAQALVNIRHIIYGLSLLSIFPKLGKWKAYIIFALTDETYSILTSAKLPQGTNAGNFYGSISLMNHLYWISGNTIGAILGTVLKNSAGLSLEGVEFALTALFAVIFIEQLKKTKNYLPSITGILCAAFFIVLSRLNLFPSDSILISTLILGIAVITVSTRKKNINTAGEIKNE